MRKTLLLPLAVLIAMAIVASPAGAVPYFPNVPNTFGGAGAAEDAGYAGAPGGTQAALWGIPGSEVSLTAGGAAINLPQANPAMMPPSPPPAGAILETTQVKDGGSISFGQEMTAVLGGLFPTALFAPGALDNGLAPGSTAADGNPDQLPTIGILDSYTVLFGPGTLAGYDAIFGGRPAFEIYEDVPPILDLDIGTGTTNLEEMHMDFDGAGPAVPPPTAVPSQFVNTADEGLASVPNQVRYATDGTLFAAGWVDTLAAVYTFYDPSLTNAGFAQGPNGGTIYSLQMTGKGVVTDGSILPLLDPIQLGGAFDGSDINITFAATLFGEAFDPASIGPTGALLGQDPYASWNLTTTLGGNSGDASFTIIPIPEPATVMLLGLGLVPVLLRRRKKRA